MTMYYPKIPKIAYAGREAKTGFAFRYYNPDEVIAGRTMRAHCKFAMSYWHTMCAEGVDMFGVGTMDKSYGGGDPMTQAHRKAEAAFEFMDKLSIDYFCFHDRDIAQKRTISRRQTAVWTRSQTTSAS